MTDQPSIKSQIVARLLDLCQPLIAQGTVRKVERANALFLLEAVKPALHLVTGDETVLIEDERGYTLKFPAAFQIIFSEQRDAAGAADEFEAFLQQQIEHDEQLAGLANKITYDGAAPFTSEETKPSALVVVMYQIEYRRYRSNPTRSY